MKKRIVSLFLAALMVLTASITVFAKVETDNVAVAAAITVSAAGKSGSTDSATQVVSNPGDAKYDFTCTLDMRAVNDKFAYYKANLNNEKLKELFGIKGNLTAEEWVARFNAMETTGTFTITVTYPTTMTVPADYYTKQNEMFGFDDATKAVYVDTARTKTDNADGTSTLTVSLETKAPVTVAQLEAGLADIVFTVEGVTANEFGTAVFTGEMTGETTTRRPDPASADGYGDTTLVLNYASGKVSATAVTSKKNLIPGDGGTTTPIQYTLTFDVDGDRTKVSAIRKPAGTALNTADFRIPQQDGYTFKGWYLDKELTEKVGETLSLTKNMVVYGSFVKTEPVSAISEKLETVDHFAYVSGYPDGTVRPEAYITREETAMMFYRLLKASYRATVESKTNSFADVWSDRWSNDAISTLVKAGILSGYPDGNFKPSAPITRAEFATLVVRFVGIDETATQSFTDMNGHWAEKYVATAVKLGWIGGNDDGTFKPDGNITRAEAMTLVNRILYRYVNAAGQHKDAIQWPDNADSKWYYNAVQEATNGHDYTRQDDGVYESWTGLQK